MTVTFPVSMTTEQLSVTFWTVEEVRYGFCAAYAVQIFEWLILLDQEIATIHQRRWSSVKWAYLLCRYYPLFVWPILLWAYVLNQKYELCTRVGQPIHALLLPYICCSQAVMIMRAYAFSDRHKAVLAVLLPLYAILVGTSIWMFCTNLVLPSPETFPDYFRVFKETGCFPDYSSKIMGLRLGLVMIAAVTTDLTSLCVVLVFCRIRHGQTALGKYFTIQGLGAFACAFAVNLPTVVFYFLYDFPSMLESITIDNNPRYRSHTSHTAVGLPFAILIPNTIACRVILQLRWKTSPTDTQLERRNSRMIRNALRHRHDI
ncbi:hypothetical protein BDQ12DRAFT_734205, partial [Crucibulum laeve]